VKDNTVLDCGSRAIAMTIACHKCNHYYVTWDPYFPHGCRIMYFKSKRLPINDVRMAMRGKNCLAFKLKKPKFYHGDQRALFKR